MIFHIMKLYLINFLFFLSFFVKAQLPEAENIQDYEFQKVDSMLLRTHYLNHKEGNLEAAMDLAFEIVKTSKEINYPKGIVNGYYIIATYLSDSQDFQKSIEYIQKAETYKEYLQKNSDAQFNIFMLQSSNHYDLGFASMSAEYYKKAEDLILKEKIYPKQQYYLMILYMKAEWAFEDLNKQYQRFHKARYINQRTDVFPEDFPRAEILVKKAEIFDKLGFYHLEMNNLDSARYYFNHCLRTGHELQGELAQAIAISSLALVDEKEENYLEALENLDKAEDLFKTNNSYPNLLELYDIKHRIYGKLANLEKENEYLKLHNELSSYLTNEKNKGRDTTILNLVTQKENEIIQNKRNQNRILYLTIFAIFLVITFGTYLFFKIRKQNQKKLSQTNEALLKIEQQAEELKVKTNDSLDEMINLVKENRPEFFARFQEIYPQFTSKMLQINPSLKPSELVLAAYIYLGLNTKDIAEYTFKAVQTIKNNRRNLRKRLNIPIEDNLFLWIRNYLDN